ncbi:transglutaminase-like domain protein [Pseudomonas sp. M47T1]|uniref:transglutaminase TgpA family protein n=1 Tax=unclassified Pseudomonas TaxID=196821 RepID=UPI000260684A|nr:DUF3488 and transglutaminase-like domain-containing protein [Pseudomonas sp. M47T1]EIK94882.1 transglutaminase-like domain protein [Pseudomonas sp. M47T1]
MSQAPAIPRISLAWLLLAQCLVIVPFWSHVPLWMIGLWLGCTVWRVQVFRMRAAFPGLILKIGMVVATAAAVFMSRGVLIGLDAAATLLVATFMLKVVEMRTLRDARVLIYLGFFCVVVAYLYDASLPWALYSVLPVSALLTAMIGLQQTRLVARPAATLRLALSIIAQALPLMVLFFVFFPRMEPLWSLPIPSNKAQTGLSESMTPGDVAELGRSAQLVMQVTFDGPMPPRQSLYWRAFTLERFDGARWSQSELARGLPVANWQPSGAQLSYHIIQQPAGQRWLYGLDVARTDLPGVRQMADYRLVRPQPLDRAVLYAVTSSPQAIRDLQLNDSIRRQDLRLPPGGDPRSRQWAHDLQTRYPQPDALVKAVLQHFRTEDYHYTLKPPALGADSIDSFLFDSRRGFCAHYAGAMTFLLRAAGIPARMVVGYQGGELNPGGNYLTLRQFDAHAWVEYWQAGQGWRSVDPTAAVSPLRIDAGPEEALAADEEFLGDAPFSPLRLRRFSWLNDLRLGWDNLNYGWQRWVLDYQAAQQVNILNRWFKGLAGSILPVGLLVILLVLAIVVLKPWARTADSQLQLYQAFEKLLARHGLERATGEGVQAFAQRATRQLGSQAAAIEAFSAAFIAQRYGGQRVDLKGLRQQFKAVRASLEGVRRVAVRESL